MKKGEDGRLWQGKIGRAHVLARRDLLEVVRSAIEGSGSMFDFARERPKSRLMLGRRDLYVLELEAQPSLVVRRLHHGGLLAPFTGDWFLRTGRYRPFNEVRVSRYLASAGVETAEAVAACVFPRGIWYRGEIARRYIGDATDLALRLRQDSEAGCPLGPALAAAGSLICKLHRAGVIHPDLNLRNVLIRNGSSPAATIIDVEKCRLRTTLTRRQRESMLGRFRRSVGRFEEASGISVSREAWGLFEDAYAA